MPTKRKTKLKNVLKPKLCPYWRYESEDGVVAIYIPDGDKMTVERANFLLDTAKHDLMFVMKGFN